jgi:hypothetical protein
MLSVNTIKGRIGINFSAFIIPLVIIVCCNAENGGKKFKSKSFGLEIVKTNPADSAQDVWIDSPINILFNMPIEPTSISIQEQNNICDGIIQISANNFQTCQGGIIDNSSNSQIQITLSEYLEPGTIYKIKVLKEVKSLSRLWMKENYEHIEGFLTDDSGTLSLKPPVVISTFPGPGDIDVGINSLISIEFSEPIKEETILPHSGPDSNSCTGNIHVSGDNFITCLKINKFEYNNPVFIFKLENILEFNTSNNIRVLNSVEDLVNNTLEADFILDQPFHTCCLIGGNTTCKLDLSLNVNTLAGHILGSQEYLYQDGAGIDGHFNSPGGITTNGEFLFVLDVNNSNIRQINIDTALVSTISGPGPLECEANGHVCPSGDLDGAGSNARFAPGIGGNGGGITTDGNYLYIADTNNHKIKRIEIASGTSETIAGSVSGYLNHEIGINASFASPTGIVYLNIEDDEYLFVVDNVNNCIRRITLAGSFPVETIAGELSGTLGGYLDGDGSTAQFHFASNFSGIATDGHNIYVSDSENNRIRQIDINAPYYVSTIAGDGSLLGNNDGPALVSQITGPRGLTTDGWSIFFLDSGDGFRIRKLDLILSTVTTIAGPFPSECNPTCPRYDITPPNWYTQPPDAMGNDARFFFPVGITTDGINLYLTEESNIIRMVD